MILDEEGVIKFLNGNQTGAILIGKHELIGRL